jgi:DNA-directed RNA polymerase specialized sigma24 family protein
MEDAEVVAAIVAGDPAGLEEAYDKYAVLLYAYCHSVLREPAGAAGAVQDTFLVATAKLRQLRDRARFRPWLYAVARNECLRATRFMSGPEEAPRGPPRRLSRMPWPSGPNCRPWSRTRSTG